MTAYTLHLIQIIPVLYRTQAEAMAETMAWGPGCFYLPLSATGADPATHYGLCTPITEVARQIFDHAKAGTLDQLPPEITLPGEIDTAAAQALFGVIVMDIEDRWLRTPREHWEAVLSAASLQEILQNH